MDKLTFTDDELINPPESRSLVTGKIITAFNVRITKKMVDLNTGVKFEYKDELFEIMNREHVNSVSDYLKFNCARLTADKKAQDLLNSASA
jgi:hypothetical protein